MAELATAMTMDSKSERDDLDSTLKYLCERSLQLQEYSRSLKERSRELNRQVQMHLNSKRVI